MNMQKKNSKNFTLSLPHSIGLFLFIVQILRLWTIFYRSDDLLSHYRKHLYTCTKQWKPYRASLVDRYGSTITTTRECFSAYCIPNQLTNPLFLEFLSKNYPDAYEKIINNKKKKKDESFCFIARHLPDNEYEWLVNQNFSEILFIIEQKRTPPPDFLLPIIGSVDLDMKGLSGIEHTLNDCIEQKSRSTVCTKVTNGDSFYSEAIEEGTKTPPISLTIDKNLSYQVYTILKNAVVEHRSEFATAVIMDGNDGKIRAICQYPIKTGSEDEKSSDETVKPIAITNAYEMGSIIKAFCMLAALENDIVTPDEIIDCRGVKETNILGFHVSTWKAHEKIPFSLVIKESNNIGIAQVALRMKEKLYTHYKKYGFGEKTGIELPGESAGYVTHPKEWSRQSILSLSYGYEIATTLIQLVVAWSIFTNNGIPVTPTLLAQPSINISSSSAKDKKKNEKCSEEAIEKAREILRYDNDHWGLQKHKKSFTNITIFGKTGTANMLKKKYDKEKNRYKMEYCKEENSYVFVGHLEKGDKKVIIGVYVRNGDHHNVYASTIAFPLFLEIAEKLILCEYF